MSHVYTNLLGLLTLLLLQGSVVSAGSSWPLKGDIELSSGFGDFRLNHFHFGLDLRTGGKSGKQVLSPTDGYVWRVRTEYTGYGKVLYIKDDSGFIYVMAHLSNFARKIDQLMKAAQIASERYYQDMYFPKDSIKVAQGELVAYSGKTGTGAPHLHFEKRSGDTLLNPLVHGFTLKDRTSPFFAKIGFQLVDDKSIFPDGTRKVFLNVTAETGTNRFRPDTTLYFNSPFGLNVECFDRMKPSGMKQAVYELSLYIDDSLWYQVQLDTLDFTTNDAVNLEYDYLQAADDKKYVRRLFKKHGNEFARSWTQNDGGGIFGLTGTENFGMHNGKVVARDALGNNSELHFSFVWGPPEYIYHLDSTARVAKDTTLFYFTPSAAFRDLEIDSVEILLNRGQLWGRSPDINLTMLDDGRLLSRVHGFTVPDAVLKLNLYTKSGAVIPDNLFNGLLSRGSGKLGYSHEIVEDGLLVTLEVFASKGSDSRLDLYWRDSLLGTEYPHYINMNKYVCFIPPKKEYAKIDQFVATMSFDTARSGLPSDSVYIVCVGYDERENIELNNYFTLNLASENIYEPQFLELRWQPIINRATLQLNSDHFEILPEAFACRKEFGITYEIPWTYDVNDKSGLCWLDKKNDRWVWLDNSFENNTLRANSLGGGSFAAVFDYVPPAIKSLSIRNGGSYQNRQPAVNFIIVDSLSGIEDDRSIRIEIDGMWLIPEYDPESGWCISKPLEPLEAGSHHLAVMVTDRAGNLTEQYLNFTVTHTKKKG